MTAVEWLQEAAEHGPEDDNMITFLCNELAEKDKEIEKLRLHLALKEDHESQFLANHN